MRSVIAIKTTTFLTLISVSLLMQIDTTLANNTTYGSNTFSHAGNNGGAIQNTFFGYSIANSAVEASMDRNVAIGYETMSQNQHGYENVMIGYQVAQNTQFYGGPSYAHHNIAMGSGGFSDLTYGSYNIGFGTSVLDSNTIGS